MANLELFFKPKTVSVVGTSRNKQKIGHLILKNLIESYQGEIYPVNPQASKILGLKCYPSIQSVPKEIDLAVFAVPAEITINIFKELPSKKIKFAIIISSGFSETNHQGEQREAILRKIASAKKIRILGPNCLGLVSPASSLNASFAQMPSKKGNVAFIAQSGALGVVALDKVKAQSFGISHFISLGNRADLDENDFCQYLSQDSQTKVVGLYLESFAQGKRFLKIGQKLEKKKPLVILKPGRHLKAKRAIASHTGSLAGSNVVSSAAIEEMGAIQAKTWEEFFAFLQAFAHQKYPADNTLAVLTNAGGPGILAVDLALDYQLKLPSAARATLEKLRSFLPPAASLKNPFDLLGDATPERYRKALAALIDDPRFASILILLTPQLVTDVKEIAKQIALLNQKTKKVIFASFLGEERIQKGIKILNRFSVPHYSSLELAIKSLSKLYQFAQRPPSFKQKTTITLSKKDKKAAQIIKQAKPNSFLSSEKAFKILQIYQFPVLKPVFIKNLQEAKKAFSSMKPPLVLKAEREGLIHKWKHSGIVLDISTINQLTSAYQKLSRIANQFLIQEMIRGEEIIIGGKKDSTFGPFVLFGKGGVDTEVYNDKALCLLPLNERKAKNLITKTKIYQSLKLKLGKGCFKQIKTLLFKTARLLTVHQEITDIDLNPVLINQQGCFVADVKIRRS